MKRYAMPDGRWQDKHTTTPEDAAAYEEERVRREAKRCPTCGLPSNYPLPSYSTWHESGGAICACRDPFHREPTSPDPPPAQPEEEEYESAREWVEGLLGDTPEAYSIATTLETVEAERDHLREQLRVAVEEFEDRATVPIENLDSKAGKYLQGANTAYASAASLLRPLLRDTPAPKEPSEKGPGGKFSPNDY